MNRAVGKLTCERLPRKAVDFDAIIDFLFDLFDLFDLIIEVMRNFGEYLSGL